jgi:hypothetical protein
MSQSCTPATSRRSSFSRTVGSTVVLVATLALGSAACNSDSSADTAKIDAQARADKAAAERIKAQAEADKAAADRAAAEAKTNVANTTPVQPAAVAATPTAAAVDQVNFAMPNFVGKNLQAAQDEVQTHGVFFSVSHDVLASRMQLVDSNWKVCTQTPAAGTRIHGPAADYEGKFDFGAVKLTESCP